MDKDKKVERITAKPVTLLELNKWLEDNINLTWNHKAYGPDGRPLIKYVRPHFDTRFMWIFSIEVEGFHHIMADFREEFEGTILDLLKFKLENPNDHCMKIKGTNPYEERRQRDIERLKKEGIIT